MSLSRVVRLGINQHPGWQRLVSKICIPTSTNVMSQRGVVYDYDMEMRRAKRVVDEGKDDSSDILDYWSKLNAKYYGEQRDMVNYPPPVFLEKRKPVRMFFFPKSLFDFVEPKTGVLGGYMLVLGAINMGVSKEFLFPVDLAEIFGMILVFSKVAQLGNRGLSRHLMKQSDTWTEKGYLKPLQESKEVREVAIQFTAERVELERTLKSVAIQSERENALLQLEARYRERLVQAHKKVKDRLDYQLDIQRERQNFERQHMINWILESVRKGITPQQQKDSITKCIQDLKDMAQKGSVQVA
ncbi:ATP synthase F(0) complex subunit B1, mitochondrial [Lingula anatina]|uniref:ATP synthase subunit b n=1 Tax=Lingula anatina TaxID=7574 RepID=A0A1S3ISA7_LINAN|nr:ATP synthase F(0) complex subunit B1, mitochondrial [Lingula anatina]|eukprot:XP_013400419.1 ATP synthase F(0) complex subunit B1, mitochondrial [Lingula anatina]